MRRKGLLIYWLASVLLSWAVGLPLGAQERSYMEQLSVDEGLPHTDVSSIVQDSDGYIWIGTYSGLCRYDGVEMTVYDMSNSILESSRIRSLLLAGSLLYIGTENGGLTVYDTLQDKFLKTLSVPGNCVNSMFLSSEGGSVWLCTNDGLSKIWNVGDGYSTASWSFGSVCLSGCALEGDDVLVGTNAGVGVFSEMEGLRYVRTGVFATSVIELPEKHRLITAYEGCFIYDAETETMQRLNSFDARCACHDKETGCFFVGTGHNGILRYDSALKCSDVLSPWSSFSHSTDIEVSTLLLDRSLVLWIGTNGSGCFKSTETNRAFRLWAPFSDNAQLVTMYADSRDRLWVTSKDGRVAVLDGNRLCHLDRRSLSMFSSMPVSAVYETADGHLLLGSWDNGVGVIAPSEVAGACEGKPFSLRRINGLPDNLSVYKFAEDSFGTLWMTTASGVWRSALEFQPLGGGRPHSDKRKWTCIRNERKNTHSLSDDFTTDLLVDGHTVWVGTRTGLNRLKCGEDGELLSLDRIHVRPGDTAGEFVSFIHKSADDSLWVSVLGLGLAKLDSEPLADSLTFRIYNKGNCPGFPNNEFESLLEDDSGNFWIGGFGLIRFSPKTGAIKCFTRKDGLQSNAFKIWDAARFSDGKMAFGGINGFNIFSPEDIVDNPVRPEVRFTGLSVNGEAATPDLTGGKSVRTAGSLRLGHSQNNLVITFSSMHYTMPERNNYIYMMKGLDDSWHSTTGLNPTASYLNLGAGHYTFFVYGSNSDGVWGDVPASLDIRILPPWYASVPAKIFYAMLSLGLAAAIVMLLRRRSARLHRQELEDKLREEQRERNENELKFHTDFLHEIKTPLTLITTPVEELLKNPNLGKTTLNRLQLVDQSAKILQKHIESITDLRKYDNGEVRLHVVEIDFARFAEEICLLFQPIAKARGYEFSISLNPLGQKLFIDKDMIEKVILNLMSNAIKYSPERGGKIDVNVEESVVDGVTGASLSVSNLGIGILPEDMPYIFDRFRQGRNNDRGGMGIGLSISRSAVLAHSGKIWAESVPGGETTFHVFLPYGCSQFSAEDIDRQYENSDHLSNYDSLAEFRTAHAAGTGSVEREHLVLIVDDSAELREYLTQLLSTRYNIITAKDGLEGYEKTISEQPDLVLTDVVMPKLNGLELCRKIKENNVTSHIPVILVSARDLPVYKMEGYQMMADDYITKPFHAELLISRIDNLIRQRECMRQAFRTEVNLEPSSVTATPVDEKFIRSCIDNIEEHISEPEFGVDDLCLNVGYSRPQLYRKIKSITGMSAIQFLRSIRLKRAAQLLSSGSGMTVTEVMYAVGFNNISYFSKIFFSEFGVLPKDYGKSL